MLELFLTGIEIKRGRPVSRTQLCYFVAELMNLTRPDSALLLKSRRKYPHQVQPERNVHFLMNPTLEISVSSLNTIQAQKNIYIDKTPTTITIHPPDPVRISACRLANSYRLNCWLHTPLLNKQAATTNDPSERSRTMQRGR